MNRLKIVDIWAEWCRPCKRFDPIFKRVSEKFPDVDFVKVNAEEESDFIDKYGINSIPTVLVMKGEDILFSHPGFMSEELLIEVVNTYYSNELQGAIN